MELNGFVGGIKHRLDFYKYVYTIPIVIKAIKLLSGWETKVILILGNFICYCRYIVLEYISI